MLSTIHKIKLTSSFPLPMLKREAKKLNRAGVFEDDDDTVPVEAALPPSKDSLSISRIGSEMPQPAPPNDRRPFLLGVGGPGRL